MDPNLLSDIINALGGSAAAAAAAALAGTFLLKLADAATSPALRRILVALGVQPTRATQQARKPPASYAERFARLSIQVAATMKEADDLITEMAAVVQSREEQRQRLQEELGKLSRQESEMKDRLEQMSKEDVVGLLLAQQQRHEDERRADVRRDYRYFLIGVGITLLFTVITAIIGIFTHHVGLT